MFVPLICLEFVYIYESVIEQLLPSSQTIKCVDGRFVFFCFIFYVLCYGPCGVQEDKWVEIYFKDIMKIVEM